MEDWKSFLQRYSKTLLACPSIHAALLASGQDVHNNWLGYNPASTAEIRDAEHRLGVSFPETYRSFFRTSNGWRLCGWNIENIWTTREVGWFRDLYPEWLEQWQKSPPSCQSQHKVDGANLASALAVSEASDTDEIFLLSPTTVDSAQREWQAFLLSDGLPGVQKYNSFRELMEAELNNFIKQCDHTAWVSS